MKKLLVLLFCSVLTTQFLLSQSTVTYNWRDSYFTDQVNDGGDFFNQESDQLGMWANTGNKQTAAWRIFKVNGDNTGDNRPLQVGDVFKINVSATRAYGEIGFSLNSGGTQGTNYSNVISGSRLNFSTVNYASWKVNSSGGLTSLSYVPLQNTYKDYLFTIRITSSSTADVYLTVDGIDYRAYNLTMSGSGNIDAFSIYGKDMWDGDSNKDAFWKQATYVQNSSRVEVGYFLASGSYTPGIISNGIQANSTSSVSINDVYVGGDAGSSVIFNVNNTYTGKTEINPNATLIVNSGGSIGNGSDVYINANGTVQINNNVTVASFREKGFSNGGTASIADGVTLTINGANKGTYYMNSISGQGSLNFSGTGDSKMSLYGTQSYSGSTIVNSGTFELRTSMSSSDITVKNGATLIIDESVSVNNLTIESGGVLNITAGKTLTITAGKKLTIEGTVNNNTTGKIKLLSTLTDGTATLVGNYSGPGEVEQFLSSGRQWWYLSSPLSAALSSIFGADKVGEYIEDYENDGNALTTAPYYTSPFGTAKNLDPGRGYVVKRASTTEATYTFTGGNLNNGDVSATVTRTGTTAAKRGYNLVGNPYPSYINWDLVYDAASTQNLSNAIWFRTKSGSEMAFHTYSDGDGVPDLANSKIAPMQAFWVKAESSPATLTFKNNHRMHFESGYNPLKVKAADNRQRLRLLISNGQAKDEALIVGKSYASNTLDSYDVEKMSNGDVTIPELYSLVQNEELVINSLNQLKEGANVQLGVRPGQAGNYTLEVSQFENITDKVVLKDKLTDSETELTAGIVYSFTSDANVTNDRFVVEFRAPGITTAVTEATEGNTQVFVTKANRIAVQLLAGKDATLSVYNMAGQLVAEAQSTGTLTVLDQTFSSGVYLVKVNNLLSKVVIK